MSAVRDLLIEIGTEELPPPALKKLSAAFSEAVLAGLNDLGFTGLESRSFATPRRLAIQAFAVPEQQAEQKIERRGPAVQAAFDKQGEPTKAAQGFAQSCGVSVQDLSRVKTDKGEWLYYEAMQSGKTTADCIVSIVESALNQLPIPKRMRWGAGEAEFVRPVHWIVLLFGDEVVEGNILGITSGRETYGHRFHSPEALSIDNAANYEKVLSDKVKVIPGFKARRQRIEELVAAESKALGGTARLELETELLDEVTALVEWPVALVCCFEESFLAVPAEALVSTMKDNQKYFPVYDNNGKLSQNFIVISNLDSKDAQQIISGNEKVVRPRLADAQFFWEQDKKKPLAEFNERLKQVVFQRKLGTVYEKAERTAKLAADIATAIKANSEQAYKAGLLCKADLMSEMVYEFPQLQGIMGRYYAEHSGEAAEVATAIEQHYWPKFSGDTLPENACAQAVALADKLDTLVGIFAAGDKPTGTRDPFALRRAAIGVLKILIEQKLELDLEQLLQLAASSFPPELKAGKVVGDVFDFIQGRLKAEYEGMQPAFTPQQVAAVMACRPTQPLDFDRRIHAVREFSEMSESESLSAANKRTANILKKAGLSSELPLKVELLQEAAEKELHKALEKLLPEVEPLCQQGAYQQALQKLAGLREPVDRFFDDVMVMAEDEKIKNNRLALLQKLQNAFKGIADIALLQK